MCTAHTTPSPTLTTLPLKYTYNIVESLSIDLFTFWWQTNFDYANEDIVFIETS